MKNLYISSLNANKIHNWVIPQKAQGFIINYYAHLKNFKIGLNVSEELFFNNFKSLQESCVLYKKNNIKIIFCSRMQLADVKNQKNFIKFYKNFEIHFALELESGKGKKFLDDVFFTNKKFISDKNINLDKFKNYNELYDYYKNDLLA